MALFPRKVFFHFFNTLKIDFSNFKKVEYTLFDAFDA